MREFTFLLLGTTHNSACSLGHITRPLANRTFSEYPYTVYRKVGNGKPEKIAEFPWSEDGPRQADWYMKEEAAKIGLENRRNPAAAQKVRFYRVKR